MIENKPSFACHLVKRVVKAYLAMEVREYEA